MKRANIWDYNQEYNNFVIIENILDLYIFFHEKTYGMIKDSAVNLVNRAQNKSDDTVNIITKAAEKINEREGRGIIFQQALLMGNYQSNLEKNILKGRIIAINPYNMVSYFTLNDNARYELISEKENYTVNDIRLFRYPDGYHWYARISNIDVEVDNNVKWNARWVAQKKAEEFLKTL